MDFGNVDTGCRATEGSFMYKIDLHTHSSASPDGALLARHYREALRRGVLNYIAVTDHNSVSFAKKLHQEVGEQIIVGEEITTSQGEIIGLYLNDLVPADLPLEQAVRAVHAQGGLVYIPHPFETVRHGISSAALDAVANEVDIVEVHNGRALFQNRGVLAQDWSARHDVPGASSSDAHGWRGWGKTYSLIVDKPTVKSLPNLLKDATYVTGSVGARGALYPKFNRLRKKVRHV
jgi:predicted metal-dependent phosphoesterase TrpH